MQPTSHQMMGYDRAITMFSPDGRLLQVEYAKKTVKQGSTAIGIQVNEGVVFIADKRISSQLVVPESVEKIFQIDTHIGATASGIISDARVLVERSQVKSQQYQVQYDSPIDVLDVVRDLANLKQMTTQSGGLRPFGVTLIIGGVDHRGPVLYTVDPTGIFMQHRAVAIGEFDKEVEAILEKEYKQNISVDEAIQLGKKALKEVLKDNYDEKRVDVAIVKDSFTRL